MAEKLKVAMVTADKSIGKFTEVKVGNDFWNMYYWLFILDGYHYSYDFLEKDFSVLNDYDVVILSGHPSYMDRVLLMGDKLRDGVITMFFPEGDVSLYHDKGLYPNNFRAWNACDIFACLEEDKISFYESLTHALVRFIHIPVPQFLIDGGYRSGVFCKEDRILVYGDLNPTNPIVAVAVARKLKVPMMMTGIDEDKSDFIKKYYGVDNYAFAARRKDDNSVVTYTAPQDFFLKHFMGKSRVCIHMSRWVGTSRMAIAAAITGTAIIGWKESHTQKRLFPKLACSLYDVDRISDLANRLFKDSDFYREVVEYAATQVEYYSESNAERRFYRAVEDARMRKRK